MHAIHRYLLVLGSLAVLSMGSANAQVGPALAEPGAWREQKLDFDYMGFTEHYSCLGLQDKLWRILRELGARSDASVFDTFCPERSARVDRMPTVRLQFAALFPGMFSGPIAGQAVAPVVGAWKSVNLVGTGKLDSDECELMEQITSDVLPHFSVRNLQKAASCAPHVRTLTALRLEVFAPLPGAAR
jgi:hypothetical protein